MLQSRLARRRRWVIAKHESSTIEILTIVPDGQEEVLPVFSFKEEAELFLRCEALGRKWAARETMPGELASVLYGPCSGVTAVALDPLPEILGSAMVGLVSMDRQRFLRILLEGENTNLASHPGSHPEKIIHRARPTSRRAVRPHSDAPHRKRQSKQQHR